MPCLRAITCPHQVMESKMYAQLSPQLSCFLALAFAIIIYKRRSFNKKRCHLPPGPRCFAIIGCLPAMIKNKPVFQWMHQLMEEMKTEIACFRLGNTHVITVTSPELACEFFKKHDAIFALTPKAMSSRLINNGYISTMFSLYGDQWKKMRKVLVSEVLSSSMHARLHDKRCMEADELVRYVYNQCQNPLNNGVVDVRTMTQHYCGNVIKKLVFNKRFFGTGKKDGSPGMEDKEHMEATFKILSYIYGFAIADFLPWLEVFDFDGHKKIVSDATDTIRKYHDPEINKRVEMWQQGITNTEEDILDVLINLKDSKNNPLLTIMEIKAHINDIILATVDNPSNAAEWTLAEMIHQPNIFERAYKELDGVVGKDRFVQESDLPNLNYIKACAKESFRLHPIAPFNVPHISSEDVVVGGYFIPKGSQVLLSRLGLGRNPRAWDEPLKYKPERHIVGDGGQKHVELVDQEMRMISFSTGRRGCPAVMLGSTLTTMILARLIQGFYWKETTTIDLVETNDHNLLMKKPLFVQAIPRLEPRVYQQLH